MGIDRDFGAAFAKAQMAANSPLPLSGTIFLSVKDSDKEAILDIGQSLAKMGFELVATHGTARVLSQSGVPVQPLKKISEGSPNVIDLIQAGKIKLVINTPSGDKPRVDEVKIRSFAVSRGVSCVTTIEGAFASVEGIKAMKKKEMKAVCLQAYHEKINPPAEASQV